MERKYKSSENNFTEERQGKAQVSREAEKKHKKAMVK